MVMVNWAVEGCVKRYTLRGQEGARDGERQEARL